MEEKIKEIVSHISENKMLLKLNKEIYEKDAVLAAAYKFTNKCSILIEPFDEYTVAVYFERENGKIDLKLISKQFCNEVLDQQVRLDVERRYGNIRELIYRQAFSPIKDLEKDIEYNV